MITFLTSCGIIKSEYSSSLYSKYTMYSAEANKDNIRKLYPKYFSANVVGSESTDDPEVIEQLLFKDYMKKNFNNLEMIAGNKGCLTVNGFDAENQPISFNLEYVFYNNEWLINDIHVLFLDDSSKFQSIARCPGYYLN